MINWLKQFLTDRTFGIARSHFWREVREEHIKNQPECQICGKKGKVISNEVHHIKPFWKHPELELERTNLVTLCRAHHFEWGHYFNWSRFNDRILEDAERINIKTRGVQMYATIDKII